MGKGYLGETCAGAMKLALTQLGNRATAEDIFNKVRERGYWKDSTIWQHMMGYIINLPPSYRHWSGVYPEDKFLFLREDGDYELYNLSRHGKYEQGRRVV